MTEYRTVQGDTWDMTAYRLYPESGGEKRMTELIDANAHLSGIVIFPAGIVLNVPEITETSASGLPPWA